MKKEYIDFVYAKLIIENEYLPAFYPDGDIIEYNNIKYLQKHTGKNVEVIQLIDIDMFNNEQIKNKFELDKEKFNSIYQLKNIVVYNFFIFNSVLQSDKINIIKEESSSFIKNNFYYLIDLNEKSIIENSNTFKTKNNHIKILNEAFSQNDFNTLKIREQAKEKIKNSNIILSTSKPFFTYGLTALNILIFIIFHLIAFLTKIPYKDLIIEYGAKNNMKIFMGEYWRFLSPIFFHLDFMHIATNCFSLYIFGAIIEKIYGSKKFIFIYLTSGILGTIMSFMFSPYNSLGASGSIVGLLGASIYFGIEKPELFKKYFKSTVLLTIAINFIMVFLNKNIDHLGHLGGLIGGFLASGIVKLDKVQHKIFSKPVFISVTFLTFLSFILYGFNSNSAIIHQKAIVLNQLIEEESWESAEVISDDILARYNPKKHDVLPFFGSIIKVKFFFEKYEEIIDIGLQIKETNEAYSQYIISISYYYMGDYELAKKEMIELQKNTNYYDEHIKKLLKNMEYDMN